MTPLEEQASYPAAADSNRKHELAGVGGDQERVAEPDGDFGVHNSKLLSGDHRQVGLVRIAADLRDPAIAPTMLRCQPLSLTCTSLLT